MRPLNGCAINSQPRRRWIFREWAPVLGGWLPEISGRQTPRTGADLRKIRRRRDWLLIAPQLRGRMCSQNRCPGATRRGARRDCLYVGRLGPLYLQAELVRLPQDYRKSAYPRWRPGAALLALCPIWPIWLRWFRFSLFFSLGFVLVLGCCWVGVILALVFIAQS